MGGQMQAPNPWMPSQGPQWGDEINDEITSEVDRLVSNAYVLAKKVLTDNSELLEHLSQTLIEQEVVSAEEFQMMLVQFKAKTTGYEVLGDERNREALPFKIFPEYDNTPAQA